MKDAVLRKALGLSCEEQHWLAQRVAFNVGYRLVPEGSIQKAEDISELSGRVERLEEAVRELNPGLNL
jgi:hypothetical protein